MTLQHRIKWLLEELPDLVAGGVIEETSALRLREHYGSLRRDGRGPALLLAAFAVLGATLVGAGIILLLAHNWENLTRPVRAAISLGLLVGAQAIAGFALRRRPGSVPWIEGSAMFLVAALGACLGLISQTYNIQTTIPEFVARWMVLTLPLVYLMRATSVTAIFWIAITCIAMAGQPMFGMSAPVVYWGLAGLALPFTWMLRKRLVDDRRATLVYWTVALCLPFSVLALGPRLPDGLGVLYIAAVAAGTFALGAWLEPAGGPTLRMPLQIVGGAGSGLLAITMTIRAFWQDAIDRGAATGLAPWSDRVLIGVAALLGLAALIHGVRGVREARWAGVLTVALPLPALLGWWISRNELSDVPLLLGTNGYVLALGVATLLEGWRRESIAAVNGGLGLLAALATVRFFDADVSMVVRGVGFILVGASFLAVNLKLVGRRRHTPPPSPPAIKEAHP